MPEGGRISLSTWSNEDRAFVKISDTGMGMSEEVKNKMFDPFFTTRRLQRIGLGMGVANSIITRHGGKIEVESEEGTGTSITLNLPVKSEIEQQEPAAAPAWGLMAKGLRVLVVDDKEEMCNILDTFFSRAGHIVKVAGNGAEAIESAKREDFDLVICDLTMPGVTGYDVIMALNKLGKVPKIGLATGSGEKLTSIEESALKVDFIINKPFRLLELASKVNALFNDV